MRFDTLSNNVQGVLQRLSEQPGIGTQIYEEDKIASMILDGFIEHARLPDFWWPHLMQWIGPIALDGSTGTPTTVIGGNGVTPRNATGNGR
jgi:hypothetical protein